MLIGSTPVCSGTNGLKPGKMDFRDHLFTWSRKSSGLSGKGSRSAWLKLMWIKTLAHYLIREHLPDSRQIQLPWSHATSQDYQSTLFVFRWFDSEVPSSSNNSFLRLMSKLTGNVQQIFIVPQRMNCSDFVGSLTFSLTPRLLQIFCIQGLLDTAVIACKLS